MSRPTLSWARLAAVALVAGGVLVSLAAGPGPKVQIVDRARIGGYAEDLAFVAVGPFANHIVMVEGCEVWGIAGQATAKPPLRKLFDLYNLDPVPRATGIAYVESRQLFVVNDSGPSKFFFVDNTGRLKGSASMVFPLPDGYTPRYIEGIGYVPPTAGQYPDHLVMAAQNGDGSGDLLFVDLAGSVVKHVVPRDVPGACVDAGGNPVTGLSSVEYLPGDRLAIVDYSSGMLCVVDFDGAALDSVSIPSTGALGEGVARLADGRIVVTEWPQTLLFLDADLNRLPDADRHDVVGLGLDGARGLAWDSATGQHLISYTGPAFSVPSAIAAVPLHLKSASNVVDLTDWPGFAWPFYFLQTQALTYLAPEDRIGVASQGRSTVAPPPGAPLLPWFRGLVLWDGATGALVDQVDLCVPSAPSPPSTCTKNYGSLQPASTWGRASGVAYIPAATAADAKFAVRFGVSVTNAHPGWADIWTVYLFDRSGAPAGAIDFSATAGLSSVAALEYFDAGNGAGGRFAVVGRIATSPNPQFLITDLAGHRIDGFDLRAALGVLNPIEVSVVTTGPGAGAFAVYDVTALELVVFRLK
jgi:hypothetical protein